MARKFLFVSLEGLIGDTAWAVAKEGHDVKYFITKRLSDLRRLPIR